MVINIKKLKTKKKKQKLLDDNVEGGEGGRWVISHQTVQTSFPPRIFSPNQRRQDFGQSWKKIVTPPNLSYYLFSTKHQNRPFSLIHFSSLNYFQPHQMHCKVAGK